MQGPPGGQSVSKCPNTSGEQYYGTFYRPREDFLWSNPSIRLEATDWGISCVSHDHVHPRLMHKRNAISKNEGKEGNQGVWVGLDKWIRTSTVEWRHKYGSCLPKRRVCRTHKINVRKVRMLLGATACCLHSTVERFRSKETGFESGCKKKPHG